MFKASIQDTIDTSAKTFNEVIVPTFDIYFPLPYRISIAIVAGIWLWGLNVKTLTKSRIDVGSLVKYSFTRGVTSSSMSSTSPRHYGIYQFASVLSLLVVSSWIIFAFFVTPQPLVTSSHFTIIDALPYSTLVAILAAFLLPGRGFHSAGRHRFLSILQRVLFFGGLDTECKFADVLVADALTSYSRVLLDMVVVTKGVWNAESALGKPDRARYSGSTTMIIVLSIPSLIRLRQCFIDYMRTGSNTHLFNAAKYASALPVVVCSSWLKASDPIWILASTFNSLFSFFWDVSCDWGLELLTTLPTHYQSRGLRGVLLIPSAGKKTNAGVYYYLVIVIDLGLRMLWTLKLTTNFAGFGDYECGLFVLELLEILRRGIWICFRVEKEFVFTGQYEGIGTELSTFH